MYMKHFKTEWSIYFRNLKIYMYLLAAGKDSGLLLNLVLDYMKSHNIKKKLGVFHQDFEAQYAVTTSYVQETFEKNLDFIDLIGSVCLWRQELRLAAMKCTGIHGTIPKKIFGLDLCLTNRM